MSSRSFIVMHAIIKYLYRNYFEAIAFSAGLILLALMDPYTTSGPGLCLLENLGSPYCPGDGLGHSISFVFRGEINNAMQANVLGPFAIIILLGRILYLLSQNYLNRNKGG